MGAKRIYQCDRCLQQFRGRTLYDYHISAHRRTDPPKSRELAPKRATVYHDSSGNEPAEMKESTT